MIGDPCLFDLLADAIGRLCRRARWRRDQRLAVLCDLTVPLPHETVQAMRQP